MPLQVLTRENLKKMSKESGYSEEELEKLLINQTLLRKPAWVQVPLPKHLR